MHCNNCTTIRVCHKFLNMTTPEILALCKKIKRELGISAAKLAEMTGIPVGTIERIFSNNPPLDIKWETLRPILLALISAAPCGYLQENAPELQAEIDRLKEANDALKDKLLNTNEAHRQDIKEVKEEEHKKVEYLLANDKQKNKTITILGVLLFVAVVALVVSLGMDSLW